MKIIVVDDEADVQFLFQQKFRKEIKRKEMDFHFALSGEAALRLLQSSEEKVSLVLSDINMPGMSGLDLLKEIKNTNFDPPPPPFIMMVTAYGDENNYKKSIQLGADDFLSKPVDFKVLKEKMNLLLKSDSK